MRQKRFILAVLATAMAINELQNRHSGPGGSTRRLHHKAQNQLWGRGRIDACSKGKTFARYDTTDIGSNFIVANDNYAPVAVAA